MEVRIMTQNAEDQRIAKFNPNEHVMQLKSREGSKDYLRVQWRLVWFREMCPTGTIDTEEMQVDLDREMTVEAFAWNPEKKRSEKYMKTAKGYARYRAVVTDGKGGRATGTGSECAADFADYVEKAETKAIGRALAALGYGTQFSPEFNEEHRIVDSPVERNGNVPTEAMVRELRVFVGKAYNFKDENFEARWTAFKSYVLNVAKADPDLSMADIAKLRTTAEEAAKGKQTVVAGGGR